VAALFFSLGPREFCAVVLGQTSPLNSHPESILVALLLLPLFLSILDSGFALRAVQVAVSCLAVAQGFNVLRFFGIVFRCFPKSRLAASLVGTAFACADQFFGFLYGSAGQRVAGIADGQSIAATGLVLLLQGMANIAGVGRLAAVPLALALGIAFAILDWQQTKDGRPRSIAEAPNKFDGLDKLSGIVALVFVAEWSAPSVRLVNKLEELEDVNFRIFTIARAERQNRKKRTDAEKQKEKTLTELLDVHTIPCVKVVEVVSRKGGRAKIKQVLGTVVGWDVDEIREVWDRIKRR
jgi:hypothetical protein